MLAFGIVLLPENRRSITLLVITLLVVKSDNFFPTFVSYGN